MKTLQVHEDAHQGVKIEAAKSVESVSSAASRLLRAALKLIEKGELKLSETATEEEAA